MFRKLVGFTLALALVVTSFAFAGSTAFAQGRDTTAAPGVWSSAILIQNVGTAQADVSVTFYQGGTERNTYQVPNGIAAGSSVTLLVASDLGTLLQTGQYSAMVSSSQPVIASVQTSSVANASAPWSAFAYEGVSAQDTSSTLFFPGNYNNYFGFTSEMVIQNAGEADTTLTATFFDGAGAQIGEPVNLGALARNTTKTYPIASLTGLPSGNTNGLFGARVVSSGNVPLAGIANIWRTAPTNMTASYNAFTTGSQSLFAPSLSNNYFGFASALTIQNIDQTASAPVTITYSNGQTEVFTLAPNAARAFYQPANTNLPSGNAGGSFAAKVTATAGSIVGLVSYSAPPELNGGNAIGSFASYNAAPVASANVNVPNVLSNYFGYFTNVTIQNTGTQATNITLTYEGGLTWTIENVPANGVANFLHLNPNGTSIKNPLAQRSTVSAVASSSNAQPLVAVIQHNTERSVSGYNPSKVPSDFLQVFTATPK